MATLTKNAEVAYESAQTFHPFEEMTNPDADQITYYSSFNPWSGVEGFEVAVRPNGLVTGGAITATTNNNEVSVAAGTAYSAGIAAADTEGLVSVNTATLTVTRPVTTDFTIIGSVTIDGTGTYVMVMGTEAAAPVETRGAAGGPPYIPVDSIEVGQVRLTSDTAAVVTSNEILQVLGLSQERWDFPVWTEFNFQGCIEFTQALPLIHTGDAAKQVWVRGYSPIFAPIPECFDWVPAEETSSVNTTATYDGARGSASSSINQASFSALLKDGHTDPILGLLNRNLFFRFKQNRLRTPFQLTQGILNVARTFVPEDNVTGAFTITATEPSQDFAS